MDVDWCVVGVLYITVRTEEVVVCETIACFVQSYRPPQIWPVLII
jgi:hypothetical protein